MVSIPSELILMDCCSAVAQYWYSECSVYPPPYMVVKMCGGEGYWWVIMGGIACGGSSFGGLKLGSGLNQRRATVNSQ